MLRLAFYCVVLGVAAGGGCEGLPRDPEGTLDHVSAQHRVRIGLVEDAPWVVRTGGGPAGIEVRLAREFAASLGERHEWHWGGEERQMLLGRMKLPLSEQLHDKALHVSATVNKGDWLSGLAGVAGIIGIAVGLWWMDAAAAAFISLEIMKDGYENLRNSLAQLMDKRPTDIESQEEDPAIDRLQHALERLDWVAEARVKLREDGDVLTGDAFLVPRQDCDLLPKLDEARAVARQVDWRLHDVNMVPVRKVG